MTKISEGQLSAFGRMILALGLVLAFSVCIGNAIWTAEIATATDMEKKAAAGDADAMYFLGVMYVTGYGTDMDEKVEQDEKKGIEWLMKAVEKGNADAMYTLGMIYSQGDGVAKDDKKAVEWWKKSSENGNEKAKKMVERLNRAVEEFKKRHN